MVRLPTDSEAWLCRYHPKSAEPGSAGAGWAGDVRLVCFPHAGGSASFFFAMSRHLSPALDVLAVQYPGRQNRRHEQCVDTIPELADQIFLALRHLDDRPLALFGHSMGAVLAYEVALRRERAGLASPVRLFASGRRAPSRYRDERVHEKSDAEVAAELGALGGISPELLADPEILAMIMPAVRSDYRAIETYRHDPDARLTCPVTILSGEDDPRVSIQEAQAWREHTTGPTDLHVLPGGHFFLVDHSEKVVDLVTRTLNG